LFDICTRSVFGTPFSGEADLLDICMRDVGCVPDSEEELKRECCGRDADLPEARASLLVCDVDGVVPASGLVTRGCCDMSRDADLLDEPASMFVCDVDGVVSASAGEQGLAIGVCCDVGADLPQEAASILVCDVAGVVTVSVCENTIESVFSIFNGVVFVSLIQ
jgi:hypothetical protein